MVFYELEMSWLRIVKYNIILQDKWESLTDNEEQR